MIYGPVNWMKTKIAEDIWRSQGGAATISSYSDGVPLRTLSSLDKALPYFILNNKLFVHAGIDLRRPLEQQDITTFAWDRTLIQKAWSFFQQETKNISLQNLMKCILVIHPYRLPSRFKSCEIWMMDTGAGWAGVLSMMNIDTKEVFTSDKVPSLYPGIEGRMKR